MGRNMRAVRASASHRSLVGAGAALTLAITALVVFVLPGSASGRGQSEVVAFQAAQIPAVFKGGITSSATAAGIPLSTLEEVAPAGQPTVARAGLVVGRGP